MTAPARNARMLAVRLPKAEAARLKTLAKRTGRSVSHYARQAIAEFLDEREDYLIALARLEKGEPTVGLKDLERRLGLAD
ncbi:MAG: ribbon-helix-helix domain-containing protein [Pseudomonadota bacterium]